jgi:hypothetical protein
MVGTVPPADENGTSSSSFNPKPKASAVDGGSIPLPTIAFGFGLNELTATVQYNTEPLA